MGQVQKVMQCHLPIFAIRNGNFLLIFYILISLQLVELAPLVRPSYAISIRLPFDTN
jgi:hypothetical protein